MATIKQTEANRRNAQKSTGPRTPEGKTAASMNALQHGLCARTVVLRGEDHQEFHQFCDDLEGEWRPQSRAEEFYLEKMAVSQWKLNRIDVGENVCKELTKAHLPLVDRLWKALSRTERSYARAQRKLERLQNLRRHTVREAEPAPRPSAIAPQATADAMLGQAAGWATTLQTPNPTATPRVEPAPCTAGTASSNASHDSSFSASLSVNRHTTPLQ